MFPGRGLHCGEDLCVTRPRRIEGPSSSVVSFFPFVGTFLVVCVLVNRRVFPLLSRIPDLEHEEGGGYTVEASIPATCRPSNSGPRSVRRRVAAVTLGCTIGLSVVLAELILAEISDLVDAPACDAAMRITVPALLFLLVALIPFLELQSVAAGSCSALTHPSSGRALRVAWALQLALFGAWLFVFWSLGLALPNLNQSAFSSENWSTSLGSKGASTGMNGDAQIQAAAGRWALDVIPRLTSTSTGRQGLVRACLERVGVIGISLMALLSGFASVSSPWHAFLDYRAHRRRPVTDARFSRKQAELEATGAVLAAKRHRLQALKRQAAAEPAVGVWRGAPSDSPNFPCPVGGEGGGIGVGHMGNLFGQFKEKSDIGSRSQPHEIMALELEIAGLEAVDASLAATVSALSRRRVSQARDGTPLGWLLAIPRIAFGLYCVYRVLATTAMMLRRAYSPGVSFSSSDPISRFLGLLAKYTQGDDPKLDQLAWARQISFLLSGVILAASANSVLLTFRLFAKWAPLLYLARVNLALVVGQIAATYIISAALLLRSSLPKEVSGAFSDALESALDPDFVDRWFEGWFLLASASTVIGVWVAGKIGGAHGRDSDDWDDFAGDEEMGQKLS